MLHLLNSAAVPYGYVPEMNSSSDFTPTRCFFCNACVAEMNSRNLQTRGPVSLPDVILSNTPPPSPLRRSHSYNSFHTEKTPQPQSFTLALETPPPTPGSPSEAGMDAQALEAQEEREVGGVRAGLEHIDAVRRRLRTDSGSSYLPNQPHNLPQLSWTLPRPHRQRREQEERQKREAEAEQQEKEKEEGRSEQEKQWALVGSDLRKIADKFQVDNGRVRNKSGGSVSRRGNGGRQNGDDGGGDGGGGGGNGGAEGLMNISVPAAVTKCLGASLIVLAWWRLLNKFR